MALKFKFLVGMVRVAIKEDPDHREPPNSVGALNHFYSFYFFE